MQEGYYEVQRRLEEERRRKAEETWQKTGLEQRMAFRQALLYEQNLIGDVRIRLIDRGLMMPYEYHHSLLFFRRYQGDIWILDPTVYTKHIDMTLTKIDGADDFRNFVIRNLQSIRFGSIHEIRRAMGELIKTARKMPID